MHAFWTMFGSIVCNKKTRHRLPPAPDHPRSPAVRSETRPPGSFNTRPKSCSPSPSSLRFQSKRLQSEKILYLSVQFVMGRPGTITNPNLIWGLSECLPCTVLSLFFHLQNYIPHTRGFKKIALTEGGPSYGASSSSGLRGHPLARTRPGQFGKRNSAIFSDFLS